MAAVRRERFARCCFYSVVSPLVASAGNRQLRAGRGCAALQPSSSADFTVADSPLSARRRLAGRRKATRPVAGRRPGSVKSGH